MNLTGNTILITGGGSGIGEAFAHRFHDLGNTVVIAGRNPAALAKAASGRANIIPMPLDISDAQSIHSLAQRVLAEHPALNVLFNNAGITRYEPLNRSRDLSGTEETIATNLLGPIRLTNALLDHLVQQPGAAIVNVTSGLAFVPMVEAAAYSASKAAIHSYTVSLRHALKGKVEVIEIVPGPVATVVNDGRENPGGNQPLSDFTSEIMAQFEMHPAPEEMLVKLSAYARFAEREDQFNHVFGLINDGR